MKETDKWLVVVNPKAGSGKCEKDWPTIQELLVKGGFSFISVLTERPYHAIEITRMMVNDLGFTKIIAVGGDGTLNEVVNGIFQQTRFATTEIMLGMITVGTGNDWGRMYNFPLKYEKAIRILSKQRTFLQDVGKVKYRHDTEDKSRYFINMAGMGYDGLVAKKTNAMKAEGKGGGLAYLYNLLTGLFQYESIHLNIVVDGKEVVNDKVFSMSIGICRFNGGGMKQLPNAIPDDGLFDITVIRKTTRWRVVKNIKNLFDGSFIKLPEVVTFRGKTISITSTPRHAILLETDGESLGVSPLDFSIIPRSVKLIVRKKALKEFGSDQAENGNGQQED
ncbi:MAG TPA: diacylglycerol kinase family lipid kinase [Bacteroidales bacterium]|nr:diacylglycerol kinase family lipid kinase [Bacteroidales bacterium]